MVLRTDGSCEVYVIHRAPDGAVHILHPPRGTEPSAGGVFEPLPEGSHLDAGTGIETLHVVATRAPIPELLRAVTTFQAAADDARAAACAAVLRALHEIRSEYEDVRVRGVRPALLGGRIRGPLGPLFEYDVETVYCRTFTIEHR